MLFGLVTVALLLTMPLRFGLRAGDSASQVLLLVFFSFSLQLYSIALFISYFGLLANPLAWILPAGVSAAVSLRWLPHRKKDLHFLLGDRKPGAELLYYFPILCLAALTFLSGVMVPPGNWDGLSYHLPRVLFFLQQGSFADFPADYWAQRIHPLFSAIWNAGILVLGNYREKLLFLPQFVSWLYLALATTSIYRLIAEEAGQHSRNRFFESWMAVTLSLFPLVTLLEANTEKNDIQLAAYVALSFYFLISRIRYGGSYSLISLALAGAVKGTAIVIIPFWVAVFHFSKARERESRASLSIAAAAAIFLFLSCGYGKNILKYGHWLGPEKIVQYQSYSSNAERLRNGPANFFRYAIDLGSLDGWPGIGMVDRANEYFRTNASQIAEKILGASLTEGKMFGEFPLVRQSMAHEDTTFWGLAYSVLFLFGLIGVATAGKRALLFWSWFGIGFSLFLIHSFTVFYDPWHGRFFIICTVFTVPLLVHGFNNLCSSAFGRSAVIFLFAFLFLQSTYSILHRTNSHWLQSSSRMEKILRDRPDLVPIYAKFDETVPADAVVTTRIPADQPEYVFFGEHMQRVVLSLLDFEKGPLPVPPGAGWLFFHDKFETVRSDDVSLGSGYYLRKL